MKYTCTWHVEQHGHEWNGYVVCTRSDGFYVEIKSRPYQSRKGAEAWAELSADTFSN